MSVSSFGGFLKVLGLSTSGFAVSGFLVLGWKVSN